MKSLLPSLFVVAFAAALPLRADLNSELAFSAFQNVDVNAHGRRRDPAGDADRSWTSRAGSRRNRSSSSTPSRPTSRRNWRPGSRPDHPDLKVWLHRTLPRPATLADFSGLGSLPDNSSVQYQYKSTASFDPANPSLQVSKEEAQLIASAAAQEKDPKALFAKVWPQILLGRINAFLSGTRRIELRCRQRRRRSSAQRRQEPASLRSEGLRRIPAPAQPDAAQGAGHLRRGRR